MSRQRMGNTPQDQGAGIYGHIIPPEYHQRKQLSTLSLQYPEYTRAIENDAKQLQTSLKTSSVVFELIELMEESGAKVGSGGFGSVYKVRWNDAFQTLSRMLLQLPSIRDTSFVRWPTLGSVVALKIQGIDTSSYQQARLEWNRELKVHRRLADTVDFVPSLYFGCASGLRHVTCMDYIDAIPLHAYMRQIAHISPSMYDEIEDVFLQLWKAGYAHGDAHGYNVILRQGDLKVFLIDFGDVVPLPKSITDKISLRDDPIKVWTHLIEPYVDSYKHERGMEWYNPNGKALFRYKESMLRGKSERELKRRKHLETFPKKR